MNVLSGHALTQSLTARQQPLQLKTAKAGGATAVWLTHSYNVRNKLDSILDSVNAAENKTFDYDHGGRLTASTGAFGNGSYSYDHLGNILSRTEGTMSVSTMTYDATNRVASAVIFGVSRNFTYDPRGNVADNDRNTFNYDFANQPTSVAGTGGSATYAYDGNLKRVKEVRGTKTIYTLYSRLTGGLVYRDEATDNKKTDYVNAGGAALRLKKTGTGAFVPEYTHFDAQGSALAATDATGAVTWRESYRPFGRTRLDPPANQNNTGYTGHLIDDATQLVYMQARYYDAALGRFYSTDPVGYQDQLNLYAYVHNDPVNNKDANGETTIAIGWEGELTFGVGVSGGYGAAISFPTPWDRGASFEAGIYGFVSERVGWLQGAGPALSGSLRGSVHEMTGISYDATIGVGPGAISGSVPAGEHLIPDFQNTGEGGSSDLPKVRGNAQARGTLRAGPNIGASAGAKATGALSISASDIANAVGGLFSNESAKLSQNPNGTFTATISSTGSRLTTQKTCSNSDGQLKC